MGTLPSSLTPQFIVDQLRGHKLLFKQLLLCEAEQELFKPDANTWCLLQVACHLLDEETKDFKVRIQKALFEPGQLLVPIHPELWPVQHTYMDQDYKTTVAAFLNARQQSVDWLQSLKDPQWTQTAIHPDLGSVSAQRFLSNWLAHDYLHIRQINAIKRAYLAQGSGEDLSYAGSW
ncbi:MAG: DinB family protein [Bacteroidota bacterium]